MTKRLIAITALLAASATAQAGPYDGKDDATLARAAVGVLNGKLHHIESVDDKGNATGTWAHDVNDEGLLKRATYRILEQQVQHRHPKSSQYHLLDQDFADEICMTHERLKKSEAAARTQCDDEWQYYKQNYDWDKLPGDPVLRALYIADLADVTGDAAFAAEARADFARTAGYKLRWAHVDGGSMYAMLEPVPMGEWPAPVVKLALAYAGNDAELKKQLSAALKTAPTMQCVYYGGTIARGPKGGALVYADDLTPRPDITGSGGPVPCSELKTTKGDAAALAAVRRKDKEAVVVRWVAGRDWEDMVDDYGRVTRRVRFVQVYSREPY
jgi:hypothetical protein